MRRASPLWNRHGCSSISPAAFSCAAIASTHAVGYGAGPLSVADQMRDAEGAVYGLLGGAFPMKM
jgi:hypothetical protein